jgi:hypothetical protein
VLWRFCGSETMRSDILYACSALALALATAPAVAATDGFARTLPALAPLSLEEGAPPTTLHVRVTHTGPVAVQVRFDHGASPAELERAFALLGGARPGSAGQWVESGVPATFRVRISQSNRSPALFDVEVENPKTRAGMNSRWAKLLEPRLQPGEYKVEVRGVAKSEQIRTLRAQAVVGQSTHGK